MNAKVYAEQMVKNVGLENAISIVRSINTEMLKTLQDIQGTDKKNRPVKLTDNIKTARFFENVRNYLKNKKNKVVKNA